MATFDNHLNSVFQILIIDDDIVTLRLLSHILRHQGEVLTATDTNQGLSLAQQIRPDLILLDLEMPDMNGFDFYARLKNDPTLIFIPVVFITGKSDLDSKTYAFELGAVDFIVKPFTPSIVQARIGNLLRNKRQTDDALRHSESRWQFALEGADLGVWDWFVPGDTLFLSTRLNAILGDQQPSNRTVEFQDWLRLIHPDDREKFNTAIGQHIDGQSVAFRCEFRVQCQGGYFLWVLSQGKVMERTADGQPIRVIGTLADVSDRKESEERMIHLAFYDGLTDLPNRSRMISLLQKAMTDSERSGMSGALLLIDLDNFKLINDTHGHIIGDCLLNEVARRLRLNLREVDTIARLGGDEFVVMLENISQTETLAIRQATTVGNKLVRQFNQPFVLNEHHVYCTISLGMVLFRGREQTSEELLKRADIALYEAKRAGRNTLRFFDPVIQATIEARTAMEADLRHGLERQQFSLYYQPQVVNDNNLIGFEALIRWNHPQRGIISPLEFIPLAEETGLIKQIDHWVMVEACRQLKRWSYSPNTAALSISVNISVPTFRSPDFVSRTLAAVQDTGINPQRLKLELTESLLLDNIEEAIRTMLTLKRHGLCFSLDDFGTGFSSLTYLKRLPLDQLKLDRSFVKDIQSNTVDAAIAGTIVTLGKNLDLMVIAEGVENQAQHNRLVDCGCHYFQGYLFGRPVPGQELETLISLHNKHH